MKRRLEDRLASYQDMDPKPALRVLSQRGWGDEISEPHGFSCSPDGTAVPPSSVLKGNGSGV